MHRLIEPRDQYRRFGFMSRTRIALSFAAASGLQLLWEKPCEAQSTSIDNSGELIIVTAQRRPERPEDVPISLTVKSGEELDRTQATDMADLGKVVPSLVMTRTSVFTQPFIRGVGKRSNLGVENGVATYVDGVYLASPISALLDLRGMERIEVLNGPQGTLFGRNATGGVIQVITRDPGPNEPAELMLHAGTDKYFRADAYATAGSGRLGGNIAISLSRNGGYGTNISTGDTEQGKIDHSLVARTKLIWRPSLSLKLTLAADYQDIEQDFSLLPVDGFPAVGHPADHGFRGTEQDTPNLSHFRYGGVSFKAESDIGRVTFMSLSAFRRMDADWSLDLDAGPLPLFSATPEVEQNQYSQEFQLRSSESSRIRWVAGLYFINIDERYDPTTSHYDGSFSGLLGGRIRQTLFSSGDASSYAAYGQGTFPIGRATSLTLGFRYTIEDRSVKANGERLFDNPPFVRPLPGLPLLTDAPLRNSDKFRELTWRASIDRHFTDELMGYLSVSRGFQSGGWNLQTPQNPAFAPERLNDLEAGLKFADPTHRFRADANIFYYDYSDLQVSALTPIGQATTNAANAEIYGLELQFDGRLGRQTDISFGAQLLQASFKDFPNATCTNFSAAIGLPYLPTTCDVTGNRLPFAPKFKFNFGVSHEFSLGSAGSLELSANFAYNSGFFAEPDNIVQQQAFATVDLSVEWRAGRRGPSVRLWAINLTDADYYSALATVQTAGVLHHPAAPRRFGVSMGYVF